MARVCISLGSNLGNRLENLIEAAQIISSYFTIVNASSIYETPPFGFIEQNNFYNTALEIETSETPGDLLNILLDIEIKMGRQRLKKWGPRNIDLDIIFYENLIINKYDLKIPHPDYKSRIFVLKPMAEIMSDFVPPDDIRTIGQILDNLLKKENNYNETQINKVTDKWMKK